MIRVSIQTHFRSVKTARQENQNKSGFKTALKYILTLEYQMLGFTTISYI